MYYLLVWSVLLGWAAHKPDDSAYKDFVPYTKVEVASIAGDTVWQKDGLAKRILQFIATQKFDGCFLLGSLQANFNGIHNHIISCDSLYSLGYESRTTQKACSDKELENYLTRIMEMNGSVSSIILVSGERENYYEYPLIELQRKSDEITVNCSPEVFRHPMHMRLNVDGLTYFTSDPEAASYVGLHRNSEIYTVVIPMLCNDVYFGDLHFQFDIE